MLAIYTYKEYRLEQLLVELNNHNTSLCRKLQFLTDYMKKLNNLQTEVVRKDDKNWEIDALTAELEKMDADFQKCYLEYST